MLRSDRSVLARNPAAGLSGISSAYSASAALEIKITSASMSSGARSRARSKPLSSPSPMSTRMRSGRSARACPSAWAMLEATPATVTPSRSSRTLAVWRKASLSSTSRHRGGMRSDCPRYGAGALRLAGNSAPATLTGIQEPQDRQHPPVLGVALGQVQLGQDAADVLFHRALGDIDPAGGARVAGALGHQGRHLAFARRHHIERITPPPRPDQPPAP